MHKTASVGFFPGDFNRTVRSSNWAISDEQLQRSRKRDILARLQEFAFGLFRRRCGTNSERTESSRKEMLDRLDRSCFDADSATCASLLRLCGDANALAESKRVHRHIILSGLEKNILLGNLLIQSYGKCGTLEDALVWFLQMPQKDKFSWNFMITAHTQYGQSEEALLLFNQMQQEGVMADNFIFASILSACASKLFLTRGMQIQIYVMHSQLEYDDVVRNALLTMYSECGNLVDARRVFDSMTKCPVVSWSAMVGAYAQHGYSKEAFSIFNQMLREGVAPNKVTFLIILDVCTSQAALNEGRYVHACVRCHGLESDLLVATALITMYGNCGCLNDAWMLFDNLAQRDVVIWTAMIAAYVLHGQFVNALRLFGQMQVEGVIPDKVTFMTVLDAYSNQLDLVEAKKMHIWISHRGFEVGDVLAPALVSMYGKCGRLEDAQRMFEKFSDKKVVLWNAFISAHAQHGRSAKTLQFFNKMWQEGVIPNKATFVCSLSACASEGAFTEGRHMHIDIIQCGFESDVVVSTAVINMYGKCGILDDAQKLFYKMPERNVISWNAMIAAFAQHGHGKEALQVFYAMQQERVHPDKVTFLTLLSACSHAALVEEAYYCLLLMNWDHVTALTHDLYDCMVDLHGRVGQLDKAEDMIHNMPFQPTVISWMTLLGACKNEADIDRGESTANYVFELDPMTASPFVMLSKLYALSERDKDVLNAISSMKVA